MKNILRNSLSLFLFCLAISSFSYAQKKEIIYDKTTEIITLNGNPYAKLVKQNFNGIGLIKNYSVQSLEGQEFIFMKYAPKDEYSTTQGKYVSKPYYEITFIKSGGRVTLAKSIGEKAAIDILVENDLIKNNELDPAAEARYIKINNGRPGRVAPKVFSVEIDGNNIMYGDRKLASFIEKQSVSKTNKEIWIVSVYANSGEKIASAEIQAQDPSEWIVNTSSDEKTSEILYQSPDAKVKLFQWLYDKRYLK